VTSKLAPHFGSVHAIDISPAMLKTFASQPAAALPNVTYAQHTLHAGSGDDFVRATPQPSPTPSDPARTERPPREKFDVAVTNLVIHHVDNLDQFFKGVASLLVPGGKIVITEFSTLRDGSDPLAELREKAMREVSKRSGEEWSVSVLMLEARWTGDTQ
jgi:2-polyprenyl-3-methyl-5-hydroxy-6-metoxy-1,4-benzoquinol methylase